MQMEAGGPGVHPVPVVPVVQNVQNPPKDAMPIERARRHMTGCCYYIAFIELLAAVIIAIIALVKDDLTKLTFHSSTNSYTEYCGWRNLHFDESSHWGNPYSFVYSKNCGNLNKACTLEKVGTAWYALLITGIVFGGLSLIAFIFELPALVARLLMLAFNLMFFGCMLANALIWGLNNTCHAACSSLDFPNLPTDINNCHSKWGVSWILVIVAGGLVLLSTISMMLSRTIANKRY